MRTRTPAAGLLVLTLALAVTTLSLLQSLVVPMLPVIAEQLGVGAGAAGWVLTANLLAAAVLTPVIGRLGDTLGERRVVLGVLAVISRRHAAGRADHLAAAAAGGPGAAGRLLRAVPAVHLDPAPRAAGRPADRGHVDRVQHAGRRRRHRAGGHRAAHRRRRGLPPPVLAGPRHRPGRARAGRPPAARPAGRAPPAGWTGGAPSSSAPGSCCSCCRCPRATPGAGAPPPPSAAWSARSSSWPAGSCCSAGRTHPLVRPQLLTDRRMLVPNIAGLMTGFGLFASFLAVTQFVQVPTAAGLRVRGDHAGGSGGLPAARAVSWASCWPPSPGRSSPGSAG